MLNMLNAWWKFAFENKTFNPTVPTYMYMQLMLAQAISKQCYNVYNV